MIRTLRAYISPDSGQSSTQAEEAAGAASSEPLEYFIGELSGMWDFGIHRPGVFSAYVFCRLRAPRNPLGHILYSYWRLWCL